MRHSLVMALVFCSSPLLAQSASRTVAPGMRRAQVVAALGEPGIARTVGEDTYLFYTNSCGRRCGMHDLVVLHRDSVVDAIFRSPNRHYTGRSSSPTAVSPNAAAHARADAAGEPMKVKKDSVSRPTRMRPGPPNDTRPSIPVNPPIVKPAPTLKPATKTP
ncbi:MAG: outer membrane protein assembly factor BamE [bacterium]